MSEQTSAERRAFQRHRAGECRWLGAVRLRPGRDIRVVDVSCCGALVRTGVRLLPGTSVELQITVLGVVRLIRGRVLRCRVFLLRPGLQYEAALGFDALLEAAGDPQPESGYQIPVAAGAESGRPGRNYPRHLESA